MKLCRCITAFLVANFICVSGAAVVQAGALAGRVPESAIFYIGWTGADRPPSGYEGSRLQQLLSESQLAKTWPEYIESFRQLALKESPEEAQEIDLVANAYKIMWRYPTAFYYQGVEEAGRGELTHQFVIVCEAGQDTVKLKREFDKIIEISKRDGHGAAAWAYSTGGTCVLSSTELTVREQTRLGLTEEKRAVSGLADTAAFKLAVEKTQAEPMLVAHLNVEALLKLVDDQFKGTAESAGWERTRDAMGLVNLKHATVSFGFEGRDWLTTMYVAAPEPREGIVGVLNQQPLNDEVLRSIPGSAMTAWAFQFSPAEVLRQAHACVDAVNPQGGAQFDGAILYLSSMLGMDVVNNLLEGFGHQWAAYMDLDTAGTGLVVTNQVKDVRVVEQGLTRFVRAVTGLIQQAISDPNVRLSVREVEHGEDTIHYLATPLISPAWVVKDGRLYIGLYPQTVAGALVKAEELQGNSSVSLGDNTRFNQLRQRLAGGESSVSFSYADIPMSAPQVYQSMLMFTQLYPGSLDMLGAQTPAMLVPPLHTIQPLLTPAASFSWADSQGWTYKSISPFPCATYFSGTQNQAAAIAQVSMLMGVLLPALGSAREAAQQMQVATQARALQSGCVLYAQSNRGKFPNDLALLLDGQYITVDLLLAPNAPAAVPHDFLRWNPRKQSSWIRQHGSFVLVGGLVDDMDSNKVAVFQKPQHAQGSNKIAVCFNDNHVQVLPVHQVDQLLQRQTGKSIYELSQP